MPSLGAISVTMAVVAPAVPLRVTSPAAKPVTGSLKTTVKLIGLLLVGSAWPAAWLIVTLGARGVVGDGVVGAGRGGVAVAGRILRATPAGDAGDHRAVGWSCR